MFRITRRKFLGLSALALPALAGVDGRWIEPTSLRVRELKLKPNGDCRLVHFSDFHHKGDVHYAAEIVRTINDLAPDFVCFTGDLVEDYVFAPEALSFIRQIKVPVYGSPGNHDYSCGASFPDYESAFAATGGAWLADRCVFLPRHNLELVGMGIGGFGAMTRVKAERHLLLLHYPAVSDRLEGNQFDLIMSGHSHGGQVRVPFLGSIIVPHGVGRYDYGYYETLGGPLNVNPGVGTFYLPIRFNCRPELTVVTI